MARRALLTKPVPCRPRSAASAGTGRRARWRRRREDRPQEIRDAALAVFAEKGFAAARMEDVARRAGVTKGTIYLYYRSKQALFEALLRETVGARIDDLTLLIRGHTGPAGTLLAAMLRNLSQFIAGSDLAVLPKIVIAEAGNFPQLARFYRNEVIERGLALVGVIIQRGIEAGEFRPVSVTHAARLCVAPLLLAVIWRSVFARFDTAPYDYGGFIETHIETLLHGLSCGDIAQGQTP